MKLEQKELEGVDGFFTKITESTDILTVKLMNMAPEAAESVLNVVQYKGIFELVIAILVLLASLFAGKKIMINVVKAFNSEEVSKTPENFVCCLGGSCVLLFLFTVIIFAMIPLFSFYNWLSAFCPESAIALKALQAVGIDL